MEAGKIIAGRYEVRGLLGRGGMGEVYLAADHRLQTDVALKRVPLALSLEPVIRDALIQEARIMARLSHSRIVRLFDLADTEDGMFLVLEFVCGPSFDRVLAKRPVLRPDEVVRMVEQVAEGLTLAHSLGVVHRDLKPSNLMVALDGDDRRRYEREQMHPANLMGVSWKVTDFGLAKVQKMSQVSATGSVSGTPMYMAPEQFRGDAASAETDVYALGLIAYQCFLGKIPTQGAEPAYFHMYVTPPPVAGMTAALNQVLLKALEKERGKRFRSVGEFAAALRQAVEGKAVAVDPRTLKAEKASPQIDRRPKSRWLLPIGLAMLFGGSVWLYQAVRDGSKQGAGDKFANMPHAKRKAEAEVGLEALAPLPPANQAPRIDTLPPVIESARMKDIGPVRAMRKPEILERLRINGTGFVGVGGDGTAYFTEGGRTLSAVRGGKLLWLLELKGYGIEGGFSKDGLLWLETFQGAHVYCFNSVGQGGELTQSARKALGVDRIPAEANPKKKPVAECLASGDEGDDPALAALRNQQYKRPWRVNLDQDCTSNVEEDALGILYVQTRSRTVFAVSREGKILWTLPASCKMAALQSMSDGTVIGGCDGGKALIGMREGKEVFRRDFPQGWSHQAVDGEGGLLVLERLALTDDYKLVRLNSSGQNVWSMPFWMDNVREFRLGRDGRLYVTSNAAEERLLIVIGDR